MWTLKKKMEELSMVPHACNPRSPEPEARKSRGQGQPRPPDKFQSIVRFFFGGQSVGKTVL